MPVSSPSLSLLREVADALASQFLSQYTAVLNMGAADRLNGKEINDTLWGTVSLTKAEVAVLDSPLMQRLRFIRQIGAAHWVYPGAVHTRFEHAIGSLHQAQELVDSLNAQESQIEREPLISNQDAQLLRLSSLFSHVGCIAFSDSLVLELESHPSFATIAKEFAFDNEPHEWGADPSFCQLLAYYIVKSPAVKELLLILVKKCWLQIDQRSNDEAVEYAASFISLTVLGRRVNENQPQLQELVNGPFDSSTLDALVRDAKLSGIPSVLDIRRLIQKLAVKLVPVAELPDWMITGSLLSVDEAQERGKSPTICIFGIPVGSTSILNELQLAQLLVTAKVRRHPKVLAAEQMLRSVARTLIDLASARDLLIFLYSTPEDVLVSMNANTLQASLRMAHGKSLTGDEQVRLKLACDTLAALRERRIWVRALQLSDSVIEADKSGSVGISRFYSALRHIQRGPELLAEICAEVAAVLKAAELQEMSKELLSSRITLCSLPSLASEARVGRAIVLPPSRHPYMLRESWEGGDSWVDQYLRGQPTLYLFTTPELADAVFVAIERLVDRLFKSELPSGTLEASKRKKNVLREFKLKTTKPGFWRGHTWNIRPRTHIWSSANIDKRIQNVAYKLNKIDTISVEGREPDLRDDVYRWLEQFETDNDIECALSMLESFEIVDRRKTTAAFNALFAEHPKFRDSYAISFGDPKDGGVIQGYFAADHQVVKVVTLDQWVREAEERPLIFVDDCCGSGSQVCDVLAAWLGREDLREPLGEHREPLSKEVQDRLRNTEIAFLFITAWGVGVTKIRDRLKLLGLNGIVFPYLLDESIPFVKNALLQKGKKLSDVDAFISRCEVIGGEILKSNGEGPEKVEKRKFGYGNRGMLLATLVNVPTQTTTLIWKGGEVDGVHWKALLPRRNKQ